MGESTLVKKLAAIRREIRNIEKRGTAPEKIGGYSYMKAEDVAGEIGDKLAEKNIIIGRSEGSVSVSPLPEKGFLVTVSCTYNFTDGDSGEILSVWSCGTGYDATDKGAYKAQTGAFKYALTQALCMRVGHMDAEEEDSPSPRTPTTEATRPVYTGGRVAAMEGVGTVDPLAPASIESQQALFKLAGKTRNPEQAGQLIRDWCKSLWHMETESDGRGGERLKGKLQNRHVQELMTRLLEDKDPGEDWMREGE